MNDSVSSLEYAPSDANKSWRGVGIILCTLAAGISANVLVHEFKQWQIERNRVQVYSNLQEIGRSLEQYGGGFVDSYPPSKN